METSSLCLDWGASHSTSTAVLKHDVSPQRTGKWGEIQKQGLESIEHNVLADLELMYICSFQNQRYLTLLYLSRVNNDPGWL